MEGSEGADEANGERLISLCQEFVSTLSEIRDQAYELASLLMEKRRLGDPNIVKELLQARLVALQDRFDAVRPAATRLARAASQMLEHGVLSFIDKLELELRLATFEANLKESEKFLEQLNRLSPDFLSPTRRKQWYSWGK